MCNYGKTRLEKLSWQWENLISKIAADYGVDQSGGLNIIWVCFHCLYVSHVKLLPLTRNTPVGLLEKPSVNALCCQWAFVLCLADVSLSGNGP